MKKKIISILVCATLVFALAGCGGSSSDDEEETTTQEETEEEEDVSVLDQVEEFRYDGTDDIAGCWSVYMKEDADYDNYDIEDYIEIIKACLARPETKEDNAMLYWVMGYNQDGLPVFSWNDCETEEELRQIEQFKWREDQTNPDYIYLPLTESEVQEIYSALDETEE